MFSCTNSRKEDQALSNIIDSTQKVDSNSGKQSEIIHIDTFLFHPTGYKDISRFYDTTISGIALNDCDKITGLFGDQITLLPDNEDDFPRIEIVNKDSSQMLTMYMHNGNASCYFSVYQVEYMHSDYKFAQNPFKLSKGKFVSGRGIALGMTMSELKKIFGEPNEMVVEERLNKLSYQEYDGLYFSDYYFQKNRLVKFRFGYEYP